ncbi:hypothetical protein PYCCODRAFT_1277067 [Trametes coccinea BRFM310]|uniref:Uncharacterized protein n=1 Tax=Trametes coccinea (strain BRFM310) TaxID=1353009 RepID=A0A1Y2IVB9_TRAC3|nr:hypothetical protein PYCCODRAFT_1277067 [Trametes coccinea BRFM310]
MYHGELYSYTGTLRGSMGGPAELCAFNACALVLSRIGTAVVLVVEIVEYALVCTGNVTCTSCQSDAPDQSRKALRKGSSGVGSVIVGYLHARGSI